MAATVIESTAATEALVAAFPLPLCAESVGILPYFDDRTPGDDLLDATIRCQEWIAQLTYQSHLRAEQLYENISDQDFETDTRVYDDFAMAAAKLAAGHSLSKRKSLTWLNQAIAMVYRIRHIGHCLRDGIISPEQFAKLVVHTELIDGMPYCEEVDADIAAELRHRGVWSIPRLRDMVDRVICRYDPNAVRDRQAAAKRNRECWTRQLPDGMAQIAATGSAEDIALAYAAVRALAQQVCEHDPRKLAAVCSDVVICRLQQVPFECLCGRDDCESPLREETGPGVSADQARIVVHVICQSRTLADPDEPAPSSGPEPAAGSNPATPDPTPWDASDRAEAADTGPADTGPTGTGPTTAGPATVGPATVEPADVGQGREWHPWNMLVAPADPPCPPDPAAEDRERPGFMDGYGVISARHVREIAARPDAVIRHLNPDPDRLQLSAQPSDPYRPSAALDTYIRARDGYCVFPGCTAPAWACDLDHVPEFDHGDPDAGGRTTAAELNAKCRFHHRLKTFGHWLDDQEIAPDGTVRTWFTSPDGYTRCGIGQTNEALFPALLSVRFADPPSPPGEGGGPSRPEECEPQRRRSRLADKHARRRYERARNRRNRGGSAAPF